MVGIVQIMEHHSLAHARLDIAVTYAKSRVKLFFLTNYMYFFLFPIFIPEKKFVN
jgi:hypothetical protein